VDDRVTPVAVAGVRFWCLSTSGLAGINDWDDCLGPASSKKGGIRRAEATSYTEIEDNDGQVLPCLGHVM
jgi:hypothetical protein